MKVSEKLLDRMKKLFPELDFSKVGGLRSIHSGYHQKAAGAWSWYAISRDSESGRGEAWPSMGSADTMADCLKAKKLTYFRSSWHSIEFCAEV